MTPDTPPQPIEPSRLAEMLLHRFRWSESPQGHDFWEERYWRLLRHPVCALERLAGGPTDTRAA